MYDNVFSYKAMAKFSLDFLGMNQSFNVMVVGITVKLLHNNSLRRIYVRK